MLPSHKFTQGYQVGSIIKVYLEGNIRYLKFVSVQFLEGNIRYLPSRKSAQADS